jgi:hypothetical protein
MKIAALIIALAADVKGVVRSPPPQNASSII